MSTALITGITGQDGSYLAEFLTGRGYRVAGTTRSREAARRSLANPLPATVEVFEASLTDATSLRRVVDAVQPDEIFNLAGQTHVGESWSDPVGTGDVTGLGVARLLAVLRDAAPAARLLQAGSAEMFAARATGPQSEESPFQPSSPYGVAKLYAHHLVRTYRETAGLFAANAILFNHESPRRSEAFVTRKITRGVARIARGAASELRLGNLEARRDWGFAGDYVRAMWLMLQHDRAEDFVIGTGVSHSVREFCEAAFGAAGLDWRKHVVSDPTLYRPTDSAARTADATRARARLGWTPEVDFESLVQLMVRADLERTTEEGSA